MICKSESYKSLINRVKSVSDWLNSLIGPGGFLLVICDLFAILVLVLCWKKVITIAYIQNNNCCFKFL